MLLRPENPIIMVIQLKLLTELPNTNENSVLEDTFFLFWEIHLEAPMSWRCRYFESQVYHNELLKYGAIKIVVGYKPPKSSMSDNLYNLDYPIINTNNERHIVDNIHICCIVTVEPVFDAAVLVCCVVKICLFKMVLLQIIMV